MCDLNGIPKVKPLIETRTIPYPLVLLEVQAPFSKSSALVRLVWSL
jgi:hypothetical protein